MQDTQIGAMLDTCVRLVYTEGAADAYGKPVVSHVAGDTLACGFHPSNSREALDGAEVVLTDGALRLPVGTPMDARDRIRLTRRYGATLSTPYEFEIVGEPLRGPSALVLSLARLTNG